MFGSILFLKKCLVLKWVDIVVGDVVPLWRDHIKRKVSTNAQIILSVVQLVEKFFEQFSQVIFNVIPLTLNPGRRPQILPKFNFELCFLFKVPSMRYQNHQNFQNLCFYLCPYISKTSRFGPVVL